MENKMTVRAKESKNYQNVDVYPSPSEILNERAFILKKNIIKGKFPSAEYYLNIQFHLLREDFLSSVRKAIRSIRSNKETTNIDVYKDVKLEFSYDKFKDVNRVTIKHEAIIIDDDDNSKKFMIGSLLIFTKNNFKTISFLAKVQKRNKGVNKLSIKLIHRTHVETKSSSYTMGECRTFFEPYYRVMKVLKSLSIDRFPMEKYIIKADSSSQKYPKYLTKTGVRVEKYINQKKILPLLNKEQRDAFIAALTQEFVVIQGPPGTGKTFVGLKIAEALIKNHHLWYKKSPMLVISHKNHALDQFLEGLIKITEKVVRVGGQSKSDLVEEYTLGNIKKEHKNLESSFAEMKIDDTKILREALVVAMTTTAAARMKETLEELKCPIVIVEEATEVLEAHVVAALTTRCQHLILLGDHKQLQPNTADYNIGNRYHLGISLFERMVNNGIQCYQLKVQHRMRPKFSEILKETIYPFLRDHASVIGRPPILGMVKNLYFIDHTYPESNFGTSKSNDHEEEFIIRLAGYLICNLVSSEKNSILSMYSGQVDLINEKIQESKYKPLLEKVKVSTLDAFQGQESEVILLSLVRSDNIGFLSAESRICVALSRARNGLYIIGNRRLLLRYSEIWSKVVNLLVRNDNIGTSLTLYCQNHPETKTKVTVSSDFDKVPLGGCSRMCDYPLKCGHRCSLRCYPYNKNHKLYKCKRPCNRQCQKNPKHRYHCEKFCFEECDPCKHKVQKKLNVAMW